MRPWAHKAAASTALTLVVVGAMTVEGLVLTGPGHPREQPPGALAGPSAPPSATVPTRPQRAHHAPPAVTPQPGNGAHLVAEQSPSPPQATTGSGGQGAQPSPARSSPQPGPQPSTPPASSPAPVPSTPASTPPVASSPPCVIDLLGVKVCAGLTIGG